VPPAAPAAPTGAAWRRSQPAGDNHQNHAGQHADEPQFHLRQVIEAEGKARQAPADQAGGDAGEQTSQGAQRGELGQQRAGQLPAAGAQRAQHRQFVAALVAAGLQRGIQHGQPGQHGEAEHKLHGARHLVDRRVQLADQRGDVDHRDVGKVRTSSGITPALSAGRWKLVM
jgi:hypothetical protein